MARCGDLYRNRVTGEEIVVLRGDEDGAGQPALVLATAAVGGAVAGEHVHPHLQERFRVVSGRIGVRLGGTRRTLAAGQEATAPAGVAHDWWTTGDEPARVLVELSPPDPRFETMIATMYGLANAGKVNRKAMPAPLQLALIGREFDDVIRFTTPPRPVQKAAMAVLAPLARARGYQPLYRQYLEPHHKVTPDPSAMEAAGLTMLRAP
jgi:mannose-6-phosphate isomerase-like protein (cupin superfamily)